MNDIMKQCPCGTGKKYGACCGRYIQNGELAPTPELLMRSRYSAYVEKEFGYIIKTMVDPALSVYQQSNNRDADTIKWLGLTVLNTSIDATNPAIGYVEFVAKFAHPLGQSVIHEKSIFHLMEGIWYYVDGEFGVVSK